MSQAIDLTECAEPADDPGLAELGTSDSDSRDSPSAGADDQAGDKCPHCKAAPYSRSTWCKHCGYYALIDKCVEIADWEKNCQQGQCPEPVEQPPAVWCGVPIWAWQLAAALTGVMGITLIARVYLPAEGNTRTVWTVAQALGGFLVFAGTYVEIARAALARNKSLEASDVVFSPMRVWAEAFQDFPDSFRRVAVGITALWATIMAHVLLVVPYDQIIDFSSDPVPERKADKVVPAMASSGGRPMTMEEAMEEFAQKAGADGLAQQAGSKKPARKKSEKKKEEPVTEQLDCLIVGYLPPAKTDVFMNSLVVAVRQDSQWQVIGTVSQGMTPEKKAAFVASAESLRRDQPFVPCTYQNAIWLEPVLRCRVQAERTPEKDEYRKLRLLELL
jgi:hypothetical protein